MPVSKSAMVVMNEEIARLYEEFDILGENLPREKLHVGVARWKRRHGVCKYNTRLEKQEFGERVSSQPTDRGHHSIVVNERIIGDGNENGFLDTVRHEIAHALAYEIHGANVGHDENWRELAKILGADPSATSHKRDTSNDHKYYIGCPECGTKSGKRIRSKLIKQPFSRKCGRCGHFPMSSFDAGDGIPDESGVVAVESIPWDNESEWLDRNV